jgi:hypothetical protein
MTTNLNVIQKLDDRPNDTGGLSAAALKAKFDEAVGLFKTWMNDTFASYLESAAAAGDIGVDTVSGLTADNVQDALEAIVQSMADITQGSVADGSITAAKLADGAVGGAKLAAGGVGTEALGSGAVTADKLAAAAVTTAKIALLAITTALLADGAVTTEKLAALSVTAAKIANAAIDATKLSEGAVTAVKIANGAVTAAKLGSDVTYQSVGLAADQVRPIYVTTTPPVTGAADGIYLVTEE